ncbi:MAG: glucose-6-phosphate isomerase [Acidimicrobiales bacterium]|nr:glucose-6-phosphate isomerase [Acidimicrobiales bacterium]
MNHSLDDGLPTGGPANAASAWIELEGLAEGLLPSLRNLFESDATRGTRLSIDCADLWIDLSRQHLTNEVLGHLHDLAHQRRVSDTLTKVLHGDTVNGSEDRAAIHGALRTRNREPSKPDVKAAFATFDQMAELATSIRAGTAMGATGHRITALVQLGIGGSHLGPALAVDALRHLVHPDLAIRFSPGVDADDLDEALLGLDPTSTLVVACSKSFTTIETLTALDGAIAWLATGVGDRAIDHVLAVTAAPDRARDRGIHENHTFEIPIAVGGRFSVGSAVGLPVMVAIGVEAFDELLAGMSTMDTLSADLPVEENAAVLLALVDVWNHCHLGRGSVAVVPYAHRLRLFIPWLQQLSMESLGKRVCHDGSDPETATGAVIWGATGTDAQHAFFQLLHQGTEVVPVDLIGVARPATDDPRARAASDLLITNLAAQADAMAFGRTADELRADGVDEELVAHRTIPGDRPSTGILLGELTPSTLGQLMALHENRTVATAALLGINPFDQWGVELGKQIAGDLADRSAPESELLRRARSLRED